MNDKTFNIAIRIICIVSVVITITLCVLFIRVSLPKSCDDYSQIEYKDGLVPVRCVK